MQIQEPKCVIRPARKGECRRIAEFYRISSDGVADYVWTQMALPGEDILDVGRRRYEREGTPFSYENCKLVEFEGSVVGMLVAFRMEVDEEYEETDPVLVPYSVLEEDQSYYICGMAVEESHRGKGIGMMLLDEAERDSLHLGLVKLSLIVFEHNVRARGLYERYGYIETRRHAVVPHPLIHYRRCTFDGEEYWPGLTAREHGRTRGHPKGVRNLSCSDHWGHPKGVRNLSCSDH